ncbi:DUF6457 domain-containing protein [Georgenia alba]|uniref:DUF6457 domain-containing protein n=1 Tax=Georgenia alba TaxID=2233858 RepID=A0ABW2Q9Z7_9MICO
MSEPSDRPEEGRGDETRKMVAMNAWLDEVCAELGLERDVLAEVTPDLLRLVGRVAHGPSRPGAPLTAFAVGLAAGADGAARTAVTARVRTVDRLLDERKAR